VHEADALDGAGVALGNVGHLVQIPVRDLPRVLARRPRVVTVYDLENLRAAAAESARQGRVQDVLLRMAGDPSSTYPGQEGGFAPDDVAAVHRAAGEQVHLIVEPGRSLTARSTVTLYEVTSVKTNLSTWVAVDGGMSDNLRPMLYAARYEAALADRIAEPADTTARICGLHCESGDVLIEAVELPRPVAGDVLAIPTTGAYTFSMANNYNGTRRAPVIFAGDGESRVVVRRETIEELGARDVE